jgi:hypothetical protein
MQLRVITCWQTHTQEKKKIYIRPLKDYIYDTTSPIDVDRRD